VTLPPFWDLQNFGERFRAWRGQESPPDDVRRAVGEWIASRYDDPYAGARHELDAPLTNIWSCILPDTERDGCAVYCSFRIDEEDRTVTCDQLSTLSLPI